MEWGWCKWLITTLSRSTVRRGRSRSGLSLRLNGLSTTEIKQRASSALDRRRRGKSRRGPISLGFGQREQQSQHSRLCSDFSGNPRRNKGGQEVTQIDAEAVIGRLLSRIATLELDKAKAEALADQLQREGDETAQAVNELRMRLDAVEGSNPTPIEAPTPKKKGKR